MIRSLTSALLAVTLTLGYDKLSVAEAHILAPLKVSDATQPSNSEYERILMRAICKFKNSSFPVGGEYRPHEKIEIEISNYKFSVTYGGIVRLPGDVELTDENGKKWSPPVETESYFRQEPLVGKIKEDEFFEDEKSGKFGTFLLPFTEYEETIYYMNKEWDNYYSHNVWGQLERPPFYEERPHIYHPVTYTYDCSPK